MRTLTILTLATAITGAFALAISHHLSLAFAQWWAHSAGL